jgi:hypothetical protein
VCVHRAGFVCGIAWSGGGAKRIPGVPAGEWLWGASCGRAGEGSVRVVVVVGACLLARGKRLWCVRGEGKREEGSWGCLEEGSAHL